MRTHNSGMQIARAYLNNVFFISVLVHSTQFHGHFQPLSYPDRNKGKLHS